MVHALDELHWALQPDGRLIDLRPLLDSWPIEVVWAGGQLKAGQAIDLDGPLGDDAAATSAMQAATRHGFVQETEETFSFFYYWDTPAEMREHVDGEWDDVIRIEESAWQRLKSVWATSNADARVRIRLKMHIARYRRTT